MMVHRCRNPAFTRWEPMLEKVGDKWQPIRTMLAEVCVQQKPIYMHNEFKGPMTAIGRE